MTQDAFNNALNALKELHDQSIGLDADHIVVSKRDLNIIHASITDALEAINKEISELTGNKAVLEKALKVVNKMEI